MPHELDPAIHTGQFPWIRESFRSALIISSLVCALTLPTAYNVCSAATVGTAIAPASVSAVSADSTSCGLKSEHLFNIAAVPGLAAGLDPVMRIDEDWELNISEPNGDVSAPQIGTTMAPVQNLNGFYICFMVNHRFNPNVAAGGMELQFWFGDWQLGARNQEDLVLSHSGEKVTWTQRLMLKGTGDDRYLCFRVVNGVSTSWGSFGGSEPLHMNIDTSLENLSEYSSQFSIDNSGVLFGSHRVESLILKEVRGYSAAGDLLFTEAQPVVVYGNSSN